MATKDDIKLPPLHYDELPEADDAIPAMHNYARKAVKADRQQRGEPDLGKAIEALKAAQNNLSNGRPFGSSDPNSTQYDHDAFMWDYYQAAIDSLVAQQQPINSGEEE